jgi:hypothetical protein
MSWTRARDIGTSDKEVNIGFTDIYLQRMALIGFTDKLGPRMRLKIVAVAVNDHV